MNLNVDRILEPKITDRNFVENVLSPFICVFETFLKYQKHILDGAYHYLENIPSDVDVSVKRI